MTLNLLRDLNPADLITFARSVPFPDDHLLTREILPSVSKPIVEWSISSVTRFTNAAKFRAYDTETPLGIREGSAWTTKGILPPIGQKLTVGEMETILLSISHGAGTQQLIDNLYDDVQINVDSIRTRLELAAGDLLTDGIFNLTAENGLTLTADFGMPSGNKPTAATLWDNSSATPLTEERNWIRALILGGFNKPTKAVASYRIMQALASNPEYQRQFFGAGYAAGSFPTLNPSQVNQVRAAWDLPPIQTYDTFVRVDGTNQRVLADNKLILVPPKGGETIFGITAEALSFNGQGNPKIEREDQPGIIATAWQQDDPVRVWSKATANAMPVLEDVNSIIAATVLS